MNGKTLMFIVEAVEVKNNIRDNGNSLICKNKKCNRKIFPTYYPTIIVNIICKNKILLARNINWQKIFTLVYHFLRTK